MLSFSSVQRKVIEESQKVDRLFCIICVKTLIPRSLIEVQYGSLVNLGADSFLESVSIVHENEEPDSSLCLKVNRRIAVESFVCICQQARPGTVFHHFLGFMWAAPKGELCYFC